MSEECGILELTTLKPCTLPAGHDGCHAHRRKPKARTRVIHIANATGAPDEVYIGRAGHGLDGYYGNPVIPGERCPVCSAVHVEKGDTLPCFWRYAEARMKDDPTFAARVRELRGKTLLCFCKPKPCHGDVLARFADGQ